MKRICLIALSLVLMLTFVGCGTGDTVELDLVTPYYEYAQKCIDEGKTDEAIKALEEGIEKTKSEKLQKLLEEITKKTEENKDTASSEKPATSEKTESTETPSRNPQTSSKPAESKPQTDKQPEENTKPQKTTEEIASLWCHGGVYEGSSSQGGKVILTCDFDPYDEEIWFRLESTSSLPAQRVAEVEAFVKTSTLQDDCAEFSFTEDGWGTSGKVKITHNGDTLTVTVYDTVSGGGNWGFTNATYEMLDIDDTVWGM